MVSIQQLEAFFVLLYHYFIQMQFLNEHNLNPKLQIFHFENVCDTLKMRKKLLNEELIVNIFKASIK